MVSNCSAMFWHKQAFQSGVDCDVTTKVTSDTVETANCMEKRPFKKLKVPQVDKKFQAFYGKVNVHGCTAHQ